jgi:2-keto-3-deoxy-L-rhamnonate aldolase RhmA
MKKIPTQQTKFANPVKALLKKGKPVIGVTISVNNVEVAAQVANMGFDFIWIEMEHSPISLETLRNIVLATRGLPAVHPPVNELWTASGFWMRRARRDFFHQHA